MNDDELRHVRNFTITRDGFGRIEWEGETDVLGLNFDQLVCIEAKEVQVYPEENGGGGGGVVKDPEGEKLNKPAVVTLFSVRHRRKTPEEYKDHLKELCSGWDRVEFLEYECETGRWTFKVAHFSKYGVDSDEEEEEEKKRKVEEEEKKRRGGGGGAGGGQMSGYGVGDSDEEEEAAVATNGAAAEEEAETPSKKSKKKSKKEAVVEEEDEEEEEEEEESPKKKKKKDKKKDK